MALLTVSVVWASVGRIDIVDAYVLALTLDKHLTKLVLAEHGIECVVRHFGPAEQFEATLLARERRVQQQRRHANDAVHRRTDLVAHVGQELGLRPVRPLQRLLGLAQLLQLRREFLDPFFKKAIKSCTRGWRRVVSTAVRKGIPVPAFSTALAFFDGIRSERLPANLLQAQRDFFGAHTYERTDQPRGKFYHIDWPEAVRPQLEIK